MHMEIEVLRIGQRVVRDDRVTTHVALVARSFGAHKIYMNVVNSEIISILKLPPHVLLILEMVFSISEFTSFI